jgi:hypothetical protein
MKTPIRFAPDDMSQPVICRPSDENFQETARAADARSLRLAMERFHRTSHPSLPPALAADDG